MALTLKPCLASQKANYYNFVSFCKKKTIKKIITLGDNEIVFFFYHATRKRNLYSKELQKKSWIFFSLFFKTIILSVQNLSSTLLLNLTQVTHKLWKVFTLKFDGSNSSNWNYFLLNNKIHTFRNFYFILNLWFKNWK